MVILKSPALNFTFIIADFNLNGTEQARAILRNNKLILIDGELIQEEFIALMKKYVYKKGIFAFSLDEIKNDYINS